jgi:hypothetical protein
VGCVVEEVEEMEGREEQGRFEAWLNWRGCSEDISLLLAGRRQEFISSRGTVEVVREASTHRKRDGCCW